MSSLVAEALFSLDDNGLDRFDLVADYLALGEFPLQ
jgi:hypothetical protein